MNYQIIEKYFPDLTNTQTTKLKKLYDLYVEWNTKINVISRKDIEALYEKHVLHALSIAKIIQFKPNSKILDLGTGGGFPGIPLSILFEDSVFHLNDSIAKKIKVVDEVAAGIAAKNVFGICERAENLVYSYDFIVSRAVGPVDTLWKLVSQKIHKIHINDMPNGFLLLKGGDLQAEIAEANLTHHQIFELSKLFEEPFFETKKIVYVPIGQ